MTRKSCFTGFFTLLFSAVMMAQVNQPANPPNQAPPLVAAFPIALPDGRVTFNLRALNAASVKLSGDYPLVGNFHGGRKDTLLTKDDQGVKYTWMDRPGYGHEWAFWRQDLQDFSALLFKLAK